MDAFHCVNGLCIKQGLGMLVAMRGIWLPHRVSLEQCAGRTKV